MRRGLVLSNVVSPVSNGETDIQIQEQLNNNLTATAHSAKDCGVSGAVGLQLASINGGLKRLKRTTLLCATLWFLNNNDPGHVSSAAYLLKSTAALKNRAALLLSAS